MRAARRVGGCWRSGARQHSPPLLSSRDVRELLALLARGLLQTPLWGACRHLRRRQTPLDRHYAPKGATPTTAPTWRLSGCCFISCKICSWVAAGSLVGCCGFARGLLRVCSWVAAGSLVGCCGFARGLLRVCSWVAAGLLVGCWVRAARRVGGCGRSGVRPPSPPLLCPRVLLCGFGAFVRGLLGPRCATRRGLRALWRASALPAAAVPARLVLWVRLICSLADIAAPHFKYSIVRHDYICPKNNK